MKKQKTNPATISTYNTIKKMRGDWGAINPITRRIENKKKNYQPPYDYYEEDDYIYADDEFEPGRVNWNEMEATP